jgi:signal transduction histidine kinase
MLHQVKHSFAACVKFLGVVLIVSALGRAEVSGEASSTTTPTINNLRDLRLAVGQERRKLCSFQIDAVVRAASVPDSTLFLQDDSEAELLELDWGGQPLEIGQRVVLRGTNCAVGASDIGLKIATGPVVNVDGSHPTVTGSGAIYLEAGKHPIQVAWFNDVQGASLEVDWEVPGARNRKIPDSALFRNSIDSAAGTTNFVNGLNYRCFEGTWDRLPDFGRLTPLKSGTSANFNINVRTRPEHVALQFNGFVEAPRSGIYNFTLKSDDGGQLFLPEAKPDLAVVGSSSLLPPRPIVIGQALGRDDEYQWSEVEGSLSFIGELQGAVELELTDGDGRMRLKLRNARGQSPVYLLHSRVRVTGVCLGATIGLDRPFANTLVLPGWENVAVTEASPDVWSQFPVRGADELRKTNAFDEIFCARGSLIPGHPAIFEDATGQMKVQLLMQPPAKTEPVVLLAKKARNGTDVALQEAVFREETGETNTQPPARVLTTAAQVQRLSREEAQRGYSVEISGVVTYIAPNEASLIVQDSTRAIFITNYKGGWKPDVPRVGELWEIQGVSNPADFAPVVELKSARRLGLGRLPDPVRPTWDQLINGSLDAQYVELQGIVTAVESNTVTLLARGGKIDVQLMDFPRGGLDSFEDALVRIRGSLFAEWDRQTHRVNINGGIQIGNPSITVEEPAPVNVFDTIRKSAAELLYFDPQANAFHRARVGGQVLDHRDGTYYLLDGTNGLRFVPKENLDLQPGDIVEVVGFPQLGGPSPTLLQAVARKTGHESLPQPRKMKTPDLIQNSMDSTLVRMEGILVEVRESKSEQVLEMQSGLRTFAAHILSPDKSIRSLQAGSRLELTGVYLGEGGGGAEARDINSFEVLVHDAAGIRVLARRPWWTLRRLLILVGILSGVLALAAIWINLLRRQVEKRTNQLQREIHEREQAERERAIEKERTRIARDIHDELGYSLAQIRLLSEMTLAPSQNAEGVQSNAAKISDKALEAARVMDEIVWAVDPQNDTLDSLLNYVVSFASEYFSLAGIRFRIDAPTQAPHYALPTQVRHHLFMAIKEALTNIVKHARATEVWVRLAVEDGAVSFVIEDDGRGFSMSNGAAPGANGLTNMQKRLEEVGGECVFESAPGRGTRVKFVLPLPKVKVS